MNTIKTLALATAALSASITGASASQKSSFQLPFIGETNLFSNTEVGDRQYKPGGARSGPSYVAKEAKSVSGQVANAAPEYRTQAQRGPRTVRAVAGAEAEVEAKAEAQAQKQEAEVSKDSRAFVPRGPRHSWARVKKASDAAPSTEVSAVYRPQAPRSLQ